MSNRVTLGASIKAIREAKAQHDPRFKTGPFATACMTSDGHLINVEANRRSANGDLIRRIADQLGVPLAAISYTPTTEASA
jgi:predicted RNase H-like nuclease (RuvC/YqgF family)